MDGNLTASDVALLTGNNRNDGMFGGDGAWWLIVLFLFAFCGWGNNGWGNNGNVVFSNTAVKGSNCIQHREGSGIITLRGLTNQCKARFFVDFFGNIAIPTGGTVGAISLAIAISGEPVLSSQMISTPAAVDQYNNVSSGIYIDVPRGCCVNIAVENTSDQAISVANANIVVTREA